MALRIAEEREQTKNRERRTQNVNNCINFFGYVMRNNCEALLLVDYASILRVEVYAMNHKQHVEEEARRN